MQQKPYLREAVGRRWAGPAVSRETVAVTAVRRHEAAVIAVAAELKTLYGGVYDVTHFALFLRRFDEERGKNDVKRRKIG